MREVQGNDEQMSVLFAAEQKESGVSTYPLLASVDCQAETRITHYAYVELT